MRSTTQGGQTGVRVPPGPRPRAGEPAKPRLQDLLLPKTVLGLVVLILSFSVGAAFSGVVLFSYYEFRKDRTEKEVSEFVAGFDKVQKKAKADIQKELEPLREIRAEGETLDVVAKKVQASMFFVSTLDEAGQPSVGSAFAVAADGDQTLALTSFTTVRAATRQPGPSVSVRRGNEEVKATVWTWQEDRDLALLVLEKGDVPRLAFATRTPPTKIGERVFAVSGLGAEGAAASQGFVADVSAAGIQHDAAVGQAFQGGPLVDAEGQVVGVASRSYSPLGFPTDGVFFAPLVRMACDKVLKCPAGTVTGRGDRLAPVPAPKPAPKPTTGTTAKPAGAAPGAGSSTTAPPTSAPG